MSRILRAINLMVALCIISPLIGEAQTDTLKISLKQALEIARSENPIIKIADKEIELKKAANKESYANLIPEANLIGSYSRTIKKQTMVMKFGDKTQKIQVGSDNNFSGGVSVNLPIFTPALYKSINLTKADIDLAVEKSRASRLDLDNQVTKAYYQLILAQDSYEVLKLSYKQAEDNYDLVEAKFNQGLVSEYDKIRSEVQMRSLKPNVVSAQNGVRLANLQLKVLLGIDLSTEIAANENLKNYEMELITKNINNIANSDDLELNSDLKQLDLNNKMLKEMLGMQKTGYMPTLVATFNYMYSSLNNDFRIAHYHWFPHSSLGLTLNIPLFKASTGKKIKQAKIQIQQIEDLRTNTQRQLKTAAQSYLNNMQASVEQVMSNKENIKKAEKGRDIANKRYEIGNGTILELNDSEVALTQAKLVYNQSIYDYLIAKADLYKTLGRDVVNAW